MHQPPRGDHEDVPQLVSPATHPPPHQGVLAHYGISSQQLHMQERKVTSGVFRWFQEFSVGFSWFQLVSVGFSWFQ